MTTEQLKKERNDHLAEIAMIQGQINSQISKGSVNELYGRINFLTERVKEIDNQLCMSGDTKEANSNSQIEKAISLSGTAVLFRNNENIPEDSNPFSTTVPAPNPEEPCIIYAKDHPVQKQKTSKP